MLEVQFQLDLETNNLRHLLIKLNHLQRIIETNGKLTFGTNKVDVSVFQCDIDMILLSLLEKTNEESVQIKIRQVLQLWIRSGGFEYLASNTRIKRRLDCQLVLQENPMRLPLKTNVGCDSVSEIDHTDAMIPIDFDLLQSMKSSRKRRIVTESTSLVNNRQVANADLIERPIQNDDSLLQELQEILKNISNTDIESLMRVITSLQQSSSQETRFLACSITCSVSETNLSRLTNEFISTSKIWQIHEIELYTTYFILPKIQSLQQIASRVFYKILDSIYCYVSNIRLSPKANFAEFVIIKTLSSSQEYQPSTFQYELLLRWVRQSTMSKTYIKTFVDKLESTSTKQYSSVKGAGNIDYLRFIRQLQQLGN